MKSFRQYLIEAGKLNARWSNWLDLYNKQHPNPTKEPSYTARIRSGDNGIIDTNLLPTKEPSYAAAKKPKKIKKAKKKTELGIGFTIDSPLHSFKDAHTESATETPDGDIMSFHNESLRHIATGKNHMVPLHVLSQRKYIAYPDLGATQFTIHTSNGGDIIHTYIRPDEGQHDGDEGYEPLLKQKRFDDEIPGHTSHPDAPFRLNHEHAEDIINGHLLNIIRNGKSKGKTVAEHHGID